MKYLSLPQNVAATVGARGIFFKQSSSSTCASDTSHLTPTESSPLLPGQCHGGNSTTLAKWPHTIRFVWGKAIDFKSIVKSRLFTTRREAASRKVDMKRDTGSNRFVAVALSVAGNLPLNQCFVLPSSQNTERLLERLVIKLSGT